MARQSKFALKLKDGVEVRDIVGLRRAFDPDAIMKYFRNGGQLVEWLRARYYDGEADAISEIDSDDPSAARKICAALKVRYEDYFDAEFAARVKEKRAHLSKITNDIRIIENARNTALTQEDLADLLDLDEPLIYLCGKTFTIPTRIENRHYIGVLGIPTIETTAKSNAELDEKHIVIEKCRLPWAEENDSEPEPVLDDFIMPISDDKSVLMIYIKADELKHLRQHFDEELIRGYFDNGRLVEWLRAINCNEEAAAISAIDLNDPNAIKKIRAALKIGEMKYGGNTFEVQTIIANLRGVHARVAGLFAKKAGSFKSEIIVRANGKTVDGKNAMALLSLGLIYGTEIAVIAEGDDAKQAVRELKELIDEQFGGE